MLAAAFGLQAFCFPNTDAAVAAYSYALIPDRLIGRAMAASNTLRAVAAPLARSRPDCCSAACRRA